MRTCLHHAPPYDEGTVISNQDSYAANGFTCSYYVADNRFMCRVSDGTNSAGISSTATASFLNGAWHWVVMVGSRGAKCKARPTGC